MPEVICVPGLFQPVQQLVYRAILRALLANRIIPALQFAPVGGLVPVNLFRQPDQVDG